MTRVAPLALVSYSPSVCSNAPMRFGSQAIVDTADYLELHYAVESENYTGLQKVTRPQQAYSGLNALQRYFTQAVNKGITLIESDSGLGVLSSPKDKRVERTDQAYFVYFGDGQPYTVKYKQEDGSKSLLFTIRSLPTARDRRVLKAHFIHDGKDSHAPERLHLVGIDNEAFYGLDKSRTRQLSPQENDLSQRIQALGLNLIAEIQAEEQRQTVPAVASESISIPMLEAAVV